MGVVIGEFLTCMRAEMEISQKELCEGICKVSAYSNYERNERVPDFLTLNLLLERMGHTIMSLAVYTSNEETEYLHWRMETSNALRDRQYGRLAGLIGQEPKDCISLNEAIRRQYSLYLTGVVAQEQDSQDKKALAYYEEALRLTCPFLLEREELAARVGKLELGIYAVYLRLLVRLYPEQKKKAVKKMEKLMKYVWERVLDKEEQAKSYPHLTCIRAQLSCGKKEQTRLQMSLEKAYKLLKKQHKMYHVTEVLRLLILCKEEGREDASCEKKDYGAICRLYGLFEKDVAFNPYEIGESSYMLIMVGDYLEKNRSKRSLTQEAVSGGICAVESYSRIENSKRFPNRRNYQALTKRLGIEARYFMEIINTGSYKAIMLRREISETILEGEYEKGRRLLKELEKELGEEREKNIQYFASEYLLCAYHLGEISLEEWYEQLINVLSHTLAIEDIGKNKHIYTRIEIELINQIGSVYHRKEEYEKGSALLQGFIKDMKHHKIKMSQGFRETYLAALNLDKHLADMGRYEEANEICMKWAKIAVDSGFADLLDDYLVESSYNLEHLQKNISDYPRKLCELALDISDIYGIKAIREEIKAYYKGRYEA